MHEAAGMGGKGPMMVAILWAENFLSLVIISMRLYTRKFVKGKLGWDDICLIITWVLMAIFAALTTVACIHGMGRHVDDLETAQFSDAMLLIMCGQFVVSLAIGMGKVVVAVFLLRIVTSTWQKWFLWFCIGSMMFLSFFLSIAVFTQCSPVESIWNPLLVDEKVCHLSLTVVAFVDCAYAAVMDFALAIFPWIALRGLNMKRKERITICVSLSLGVFAGVCGVVRTSGLEALSNSADYLFAISDSIIWTASEVTTTIVCVCLPALRPLWNKAMNNQSSSAGYHQHDSSNNNGLGGSYKLNSFSTKQNDVDLAYKNRNFADVEATRGQTTIKNDSDESILLQADSKQIMRTQEVHISYS